MEENRELISEFDENFSSSNKKAEKKSDDENLNSNAVSDKLKKIFNDYNQKKINKENYKKYQQLFSEIEIKNEIEGRIYYKLSVFLNNIELERKMASISKEMDKKIEELNLQIKKLDDNSKKLEDNIKIALKESHDMKAEI